MLIHSFRAYGIPKPQARPRAFVMGTSARIYSPKTDWFRIVHQAALEHRPPVPMDLPVYLNVRFVMPRPKSKRTQRWACSRPDSDNLLKAVMDAMTNAKWWTDDGRVALVTLQKLYETAELIPGVIVECSEMD